MPLIRFRRRLMLGRRAQGKMGGQPAGGRFSRNTDRGLSSITHSGSPGLIRAAEKFDHAALLRTYAMVDSPGHHPRHATRAAPSAYRCLYKTTQDQKPRGAQPGVRQANGGNR